MEQVGSFARSIIGILAPMIMLFALGACGPQAVSGDENTVFIKAGPLSTIGDVESSAQSYCARYGKSASIEGGAQSAPDSLQETYRFDCVDNPQ
jgi:hypothetical protein